jgi:hypothetical protein
MSSTESWWEKPLDPSRASLVPMFVMQCMATSLVEGYWTPSAFIRAQLIAELSLMSA